MAFLPVYIVIRSRFREFLGRYCRSDASGAALPRGLRTATGAVATGGSPERTTLYINYALTEGPFCLSGPCK